MTPGPKLGPKARFKVKHRNTQEKCLKSSSQEQLHQKCQYLHKSMFFVLKMLNCKNRNYPGAKTGTQGGVQSLT